MLIPQDTIDEIRRRNDIVDVVGSYVPLKKAGSGYVGLCPFHNEKTPSFHVSPSRQIYHCFGCHKGGSVIGFVMEYDNLSFPEAVRMLGDRAGVIVPDNLSGDAKREISRKALILDALKEAAVYYYKLLRSPAGEQGRRYLAGRGITAEMARQFGLGYAGKGNSAVTDHLSEKGFDISIIKDAGLCIIDEKYGARDRFFNRVMFPIWDSNKKIIGFGGRVFGDGKPKYLNSPETPVFDKGRNLYAMNFARSSRKDSIILCEGYMDVISMHQAGFDQAVASLGTALTPGQAAIIARVSKNAYISYDSDEAGVNAALKAIDILKGAGVTAKIIKLDPYKDPDELIKTVGAEEMIRRMDNAENSFDFRLNAMERGLDLNNPEEKTGFLARAAGYLAGIDDELERENHLNSVAEKYKIAPDIIRRKVRDQALKNEYDTKYVEDYGPSEPGIRRNEQKRDPSVISQRLLLACLSEDPGLYQRVKEHITPDSFTDELCKKTSVLLFEQLDKGSCDPSSIVDAFQEPEESGFVAGIFYEELKGVPREGRERDSSVRDLLVKVRTAGYMRDVADSGKDPEALNRIIKGKLDIENLKKMEFK